MLNILKFIIIFFINNSANALYSYNENIDNKQTLLIKYFNNTNCSNNYSHLKSYTDECSQGQNYISCCYDILKQHEINKKGEIGVCYLLNSYESYYYDCKNIELLPIDYDFWMIRIFYFLLGIMFFDIIVTLCCNYRNR